MATIKTTVLVFFLGMALLNSGKGAWADDATVVTVVPVTGAEIRHDRREDRREIRREARTFKVYFINGRWYKRGLFGRLIPVRRLTVGVYVDSLPPIYRPVVVRGVTYYYGKNDTYFSPSYEGGYTVVNI